MILYVISDRGQASSRIGRKIVAIRKTWRDLGYDVDLVCGGDVDAVG